MNVQDMQQIHLRLRAARFLLGKMNTLAVIHQAGKVVILDEDLPLTAGQKAGLKTRFDNIKDKVKAASDKLTAPTGKVGVVDNTAVLAVQEAPARLFNIINDLLEQTKRMTDTFPEPAIDASGDYTPVDFPDQVAQQSADALATLTVAAKWWINQEAAKF